MWAISPPTPHETWIKSRFMNIKYIIISIGHHPQPPDFLLINTILSLFSTIRITVVDTWTRMPCSAHQLCIFSPRRGRAKLIHSWAGREWSKPQENRLSLRFCRNNVIFLRYWQQLCGGERYEIILSENISFLVFFILKKIPLFQW